MDDADPVTPLSLDGPSQSIPSGIENIAVGPTPVWKASSTPRVDMKAVMAEAAASRVPSSVTPSGTTRTTPQRERRLGTDGIAGGSLRSSSSPWKLGAASQAPVPSPANSPGLDPSSSFSQSQEAFSVARPVSKPKPPPTPPRQQSGHPGLGPVFTPSRQPIVKSNPSTPRRVSSSSSSKAWTLPPVEPVVARSPPTTGMSLVAIQQLQLEQGLPSSKDKRSLREIQEEERAQQQEAEFLKWWAAEEERVRLEAEELSKPQTRTKPPRRGKAGRR